jgi:chemotaxis signal transduction protein
MESIKALQVGCGSDLFAIDLKLAREVIYSPSILKLPQPTLSIIGMTVWGGRETPVHDLSLALGSPLPITGGELVMLVMDSMSAGLLVEFIGGIIFLSGTDMIKVNDELTGGRDHIRSGFQQGNRILYLLEIERLLGLNREPAAMPAVN